ncbi:hypothetical protein [Taibaiella koreensis]|uniref:hypothetical protein n=1 Tax=Taibaiella koreensis TaxID=1268548 RepID=UPI000E59A037|nr:hypothetical protein [Taibaiella koreensis]
MAVAETRKNELHQLVRSLESHEKAYYRKMTKRYADRNQSLHLRLFDLLESSTVNDEKLFMQKMGVKSASHFSGLKNHLWNDVLSSLVYQRRNDPLIQLQFIMLEAETLLAKNLVASTEKLIDIAWATALKYELYSTQLKLLHLYYKVLPYYDYKHFKKESDRLLILQREVLQRLQWEQQLQVLRRELITFKQFTYLRCTPEQLERIAAIEIELEQLPLHEDCILLRIMHHFNQCAAAHLAYRFAQCALHVEALTRLWQQHPHHIEHSPALFFNCCDYVFYNAFALKDPLAAAHYLDIFGELARTFLDKREAERWEIMAFHTRLKIFHKQARYTEVAALIARDTADILAKTYRALPPVMGLSIICSVCISYFVLEQYDKAEDLLLDAVNINQDLQREDILYFTSIFYLLILLEKKCYLQLSNAISTNYFRLYNKKKLLPFEKDLMLFLKHLGNATDEKERLHIIRGFMGKLEHYRNDPVKELYFLYFNYYGWLESKIENISYTSYISRQVAAQAIAAT